MATDQILPYHRRFRPRSLTEYIGNAKIKSGVMAALRNQVRPQVILMQGNAGSGKTSMARLLGKEYLCENRNEETGACGQCYNCKQLEAYIETGDSGMLMNVREIDVTDSNKKQDIDELLEDAAIPAFDGGWKIYVLDEVHALSTSGQTRLLKSLEEPAERVLMILCTTDPQKLLETIISRCQYIFKVTKPNRQELSTLLARVCKAEGVAYDAKALSLVCVNGDFVPRKALIALEQVIREKGIVNYANTVEVLNVVAEKYFFEFYDHLLHQPINIMSYVTFLGNLKSSLDLKQFVDSLLTFTTRGIYISNGVVLEGLDRSEIEQYIRLFNRFEVGALSYLLSLLLDIKSSNDIETRLLLLGYTGLRAPASSDLDFSTEAFAPNDAIGVGTEKITATANYLDSITMSDQEQKDFVAEHSRILSPDDLASFFQGTKVVLED